MDISLKCVGKGTAPASDPTLALLKMEREEHALKEDLKFYFMNPCDKYRARHQIPWKLLLQVLKIVMVTTQLVLFGLSNQLVVSFKEENTMAFKHLFLKGYTGTDEDDYSRTVYTQKDLYDSIFFAIDQIIFNNQAHSGKIKIFFDSDATIQDCKDWHISGSIQKNTHYTLVFDAFVILTCLTSLILCTRSIVLAVKLQKRFVGFFLDRYNHYVCTSDKLEFINGWYVLVIISDLMTIIGSILKMEIKAKNLTSYDVCSLLLGTSTLLVWVGVIRYLGYFQKYNVLILTMQASLPKVLRFCCCAGMIYLGYTFCGWIVLGPYHEKFEDLNTVAECLFSLVNGDDMFATFAQIQQKSTLVWLFSRLYLYSFISLFIYMILSLFIALITDSYETIKNYQQNGFPATDLQEFLKGSDVIRHTQNCGEVPQSGVSLLCCCCRRPCEDDDLILIN
ncbi:mucolipin-2 [Bombina bombina]|uniref:mucolipin-2 n=1 Tax=Bombina bombina TaxID=8345 RepID=UPI00235AB403|nr:mucolipin-2 [Bombina bombina]